jgi:hypothetical protein
MATLPVAVCSCSLALHDTHNDDGADANSILVLVKLTIILRLDTPLSTFIPTPYLSRIACPSWRASVRIQADEPLAY